MDQSNVKINEDDYHTLKFTCISVSIYPTLPAGSI